MHGNEIIYALICTKNHVLLCRYSMLSPTWTFTLDGNFSCSSSWEHFRHRSPKRHWGELIWHSGIVPRVSFFLWKLMHRGLPTDDRMHTTTHAICSRCHCCRSPESETMKHLFFHSEVAAECWHQLLVNWLPALCFSPHVSPWELFRRAFDSPTSSRGNPLIRITIAYMFALRGQHDECHRDYATSHPVA